MSPFVHLILCQRLWCPVASPDGHVVVGDPLCATGVEWEKTPNDRHHAARQGPSLPSFLRARRAVGASVQQATPEHSG